MKFFIVLSSILAAAVAAPSVIYAGETLITSPLLRQYHAQDSLGQYSYGYEGGPSAKNEVRALDGVTRGSYSYVDPSGKLQSVAYSADALNGFRVAATNLPEAPKELVVAPLKAPEPVVDTPEVAAARAAHLKIVEEGGVAPLPKAAPVDLPEPVKETEEVAEAREKHLKAIEDAKLGKVELPVAPELKPIEDTVEVKLAKEAHLKALENAKLINTPVENIQLISSLPATRIAAISQPALAVAPVAPVLTKVAAPSVISTNVATPIVKTIRLAEPAFAPIVPASRFYEIKQVADPYAYKWNIDSADFSTRTIVNAGIPTGYEIPNVILDNGRLIRSVEKN